MTAPTATQFENRILLLAPTPVDADLTGSILAGAGMDCDVCISLEDVCQTIPLGAGVVLLPEEAFASGAPRGLMEVMGNQPVWSDLPVLILTRQGANSPSVFAATQALGNVTLLERPMRVGSFVSAVRTALRARARQYELRDQLAERERTTTALRESDRRKDEFLAMLAHELRNPMAPLKLGVALARAGKADDQTLELMEHQVEHLAHLVDDLLDVSRIMRGKQRLQLETVELAPVLKQAVELTRSAVESRGHKLTLIAESTPVWLLADRVRLAQIFANLLNNAAKYTPDGGEILLRVEARGVRVVVSVRDSGLGIDPELLPHVFELFVQADRSIERAQGGLGIGLTLVRSLVEMHEGTVTAASEGMGRGSTFSVQLPIAEAPQEAAAESLAAPLLRRLKVLVVEDNVSAATVLGKMLTRFWDHEVQTAHDGLTALDMAKDFRPDLILMDIGLPQMSGLETATAMRTYPALAETLMVALTGYAQADDRQRSREAGFDEHVVKPISVQTLESLFLHPKLRTG